MVIEILSHECHLSLSREKIHLKFTRANGTRYELGDFIAHSGFQKVTCEGGYLSSNYNVSTERGKFSRPRDFKG